MFLSLRDLNPSCSSPSFHIQGLNFRKFPFREWLFKELQEPQKPESFVHKPCTECKQQQSLSPRTANKLNPELETPYSGEVKGNSASELGAFWLPWQKGCQLYKVMMMMWQGPIFHHGPHEPVMFMGDSKISSLTGWGARREAASLD